MPRKQVPPEASPHLLPHVLPVGFAAYGQLANERASRAALQSLLAEQKATPRHLVYGVTNLAGVSDLLFAETCRELDIPVRLLLPLSREDLRESFSSADWSRAEQIMHAALSVEFVGHECDRDENYFECAIQTIQQSKLLIVLDGGSEELIAFARATGRAVRIVHSESGAVDSLAPTLRKDNSGAELTYLNNLPTPQPADPSATVPEQWLARLDASAVLVAPQFRKLAQIPIICTALAAFASAAERTHSSAIWAAIWAAAGAVLGIVAAALPTVLGLNKRQALWVRIRTAAEVSRSFVALWNLPESYQVVGPEILPELSEMLLSLNFLKSSTPQPGQWTVAGFIDQYLQSRLIDQKKYFHRQATAAARKGRQFRNLAKVSAILAILISVAVFVAHSFFHAQTSGALPLIAAALFQLATIAGALLVVNDCDRRQSRYQELYDALATWEVELRAFRTWPPVVQAVNRIERALIVELLEWRSLLKNMKMPRN